MKRTFIYSDAKSNKFWSIELSADGKSYTVTYGKVGAAGQALTKDFPSADACNKSADKLITEKTGKGYVEQGGASSAAVTPTTAAKPTPAPKTVVPVATTLPPATGILAKLRDFYGLPITDAHFAARTETLTEPALDCADLVEAHCTINFDYFGSLDKTLSGFFILDDTGDDYLCLDLRDTGMLYEHEHEEGYLYLQYTSFEKYSAYREALAEAKAQAEAQGRDFEQSKVYAPFKPKKSDEIKSTRIVSTKALAERYRWIRYALAKTISTQTPDSSNHLTGCALGDYQRIWKSASGCAKTFAAELPYLSGDPHLALYWLLHTTLFAQDDRRAQVLAAIASIDSQALAHPLLRSFVETFGGMQPQTDLPCVPHFRQRRSRLVVNAESSDRFRRSRALLRFEIDPIYFSLAKAGYLIEALDAKSTTTAEIAATLARIPDPAPIGKTVLLATLDQRSGKSQSSTADTLARRCAASDCDIKANDAITALADVASVISDTAALENAIIRLRTIDYYHPRLTELAISTQARTDSKRIGTPQELAADQELAKTIESILTGMDAVESSDKDAVLQKGITELTTPKLQDALARRILLRTIDNHDYDEFPVVWAFMRNWKGNSPDRLQLASGTLLSCARNKGQYNVHRAISEKLMPLANGPDSPAVQFMSDILGGPMQPGVGNFDDAWLRLSAFNVVKKYCAHERVFKSIVTMLPFTSHCERARMEIIPDLVKHAAQFSDTQRSQMASTLIGQLMDPEWEYDYRTFNLLREMAAPSLVPYYLETLHRLTKDLPEPSTQETTTAPKTKPPHYRLIEALCQALAKHPAPETRDTLDRCQRMNLF